MLTTLYIVAKLLSLLTFHETVALMSVKFDVL